MWSNPHFNRSRTISIAAKNRVGQLLSNHTPKSSSEHPANRLEGGNSWTSPAGNSQRRRRVRSLGLLLVLYALSYGPVVVVTLLTATLPLWVVLGSKLFLRDLEKITPRIVAGAARAVVAGTIAITLAKT